MKIDGETSERGSRLPLTVASPLMPVLASESELPRGASIGGLQVHSRRLSDHVQHPNVEATAR